MAWGYRGRGFNSSWKRKRGSYGYGRRRYGGYKRSYARKRGMYQQGFRRKYSTGMLLNKAELKASTEAISLAANELIPLGKAWTSLVIPTNIAAGDDIWERDGRQIRLASLLLRLRFDNTKSYSLTVGGTSYSPNKRASQAVRLVVIWDKYPNGAQATAADVFQTTEDGGNPAIENIMAPMELKNRRRFKMLADKIFQMGTQEDTTCNSTGQPANPNPFTSFGAPATKYMNLYIKLKGRETTYGGTSAAIGSTNEGAILVWATTSAWGPIDGNIGGAGIQGEACGVIGISRLRYTG